MHKHLARTRKAAVQATLYLLVAAAGLAWAPPADAAPSPGDGTEQSLGNDVSWPQCNKALPDAPAFGIVGVNNGLANTTNPCLADQLRWAESISVNPTEQPSVALYVNTANPGLAGSWWPTSNTYPASRNLANPYGNCKDNDAGVACAYIYGYAKAYDDASLRGINHPAGYLWWLDVETENSWSADRNANRAVLEGMTDFFHSIHAEVGIYSSSSQWGQIVGAVPGSSNLHALPSWLAGARTVSEAKANCLAAPLTAGGQVTMTQFVSRGFDYDNSCT